MSEERVGSREVASRPSLAPASLCGLIVGLTLAAVTVVTWDHVSSSGREPRQAAFQRLAGGLGLGPAADIARCPFGFDPRLGDACQADLGPIPGGAFFCRHHASSVLFYRPLKDNSPRRDRGQVVNLPLP
jgi:hypothetical protein